MIKKIDISLTFLGEDAKRMEAILIQHGFTDQAETLSVQAEQQGVDMSECIGECNDCKCSENTTSGLKSYIYNMVGTPSKN